MSFRAYLSHGVYGGFSEFVGEVVSLYEADAVLTLEAVRVSILEISSDKLGCLKGGKQTVTVPSSSIARLTILWTTCSAFSLSLSPYIRMTRKPVSKKT